MFATEGGPATVSLCQRASSTKSPRQVGRSGSPCANSIHTPAPPAGLTRCRTGGTAAPTRWPPRPSAQAFGRMSAPALPPVCARGRYHTRPAARRGVAGHRQVTGRAAARPVKAVGARGHQGGQCTGAAGSPGHPDKVQVARRPAVPKGRLDNHRWAPCSCYTPAPPLWCSRRCPASGHGAPANPCSDRPPL
jgi:hypothetical protein